MRRIPNAIELEIVHEVSKSVSPLSPMNKIIVNSIEAVEEELNKELVECEIYLHATQV